MGQILGFLVIFAIIYFPFIKPLTVLNRGDIVLRRSPTESKLANQKTFSIAITLYHLALSLFAFIFGIIRTSQISKDLGDSFVTGYDFLVIAILGTIAICFTVTLYYLIKKKDNTENLLKLGFILPIHCIIGILCSFLLGGHLFFNLNQKLIGILLFFMLLVEIIYIINVYRFQKQAGVVWEKPKTTTDKTKSP